MTLDEIADTLKNDPARITLAYAFNSTGKTRLCVAYKNATKQDDGSHTGVYYNAYSEDLFVWDDPTPELVWIRSRDFRLVRGYALAIDQALAHVFGRGLPLQRRVGTNLVIVPVSRINLLLCIGK